MADAQIHSARAWEKTGTVFGLTIYMTIMLFLCQNGMIDPGYQKLLLTTWNTQSKELVVLAVIVLLHAPLVLLSPFFIGTVYLSLGAVLLQASQGAPRSGLGASAFTLALRASSRR